VAYPGPVPALGGPITVAALLLVIGGASKLRRPANTVHALRAMGLPAMAPLVRVLALCEVVIGLSAVLIGDRITASLLAASYLGFACFVGLAMVRGGALSSCGCFGSPDTPPTSIHVLITLAAAAVSLGAVAHPVGGLVGRLFDQPLGGIPFIVVTGASVWFAYAALAVLPKTTGFIGRSP
jgi:hypothetical protein